MNWDIVVLAESRTAKYDFLLKHFVSPGDSALRKLLGIEHAISLPTEFANLHAERADGLFELAEETLVHIEFQTRWQSDMAWRMLDYRLRIIETHHRKRHRDDIAIRQFVLYIGNAPLKATEQTLSSPDADGTDVLSFRFEAGDIRGWAKHAPLLLKSRIPDNWILGLLCLQQFDIDLWATATRRIRELRSINSDACADACAKLLVVATLRDVPPNLIEDLRKMALALDVQNSEIWKEVFDKGQRTERLEALQDLIESRGLVVSQWVAEQINELSTEELLDIRKLVKAADDIKECLAELGYKPPHGMSLNGG